MEKTSEKQASWLEDLKKFTNPTVIRMLFMGFAAGLPILLIFSSLGVWLREAGVARSTVTFFSWAGLGYSFKFVWAPLVDALPIPVLTKLLGRRRSWILLSQVGVIIGILGMALTDPVASTTSLTTMALFAVVLGFSSATQDTAIDAFRIESDVPEMQALLSSTYIAGYRIAMLVAGAGSFYLATWFGAEEGNYNYTAWMWAYICMALVMLVGVATVLWVPEPDVPESVKKRDYSNSDYARFVLLFLGIAATFALTFFYSADLTKSLKTSFSDVVGKGLGGFLVESTRMITAIFAAFVVARVLIGIKLINQEMANDTYIEPVRDFFKRYGQSSAILLLSLIGLYRISDIVLGVISNVFYYDLGFTKNTIGSAVKFFGFFPTLFGGFLGGFLTIRYGVMRIMLWGAILSAATNLLFLLLTYLGDNVPLYLVVTMDNLAAGVASAAFVAFLSSLVNISFTAVQYAIFTSLMTLFPKVLGGYSGTMVDAMGYSGFFTFTTLIGVPVIWLVIQAGRKLEIKEPVIKDA